MKILIACEMSGRTREAFRALGHDAWSCDLKPAMDDSPHHLQMDIFKAIKSRKWSMMIAHPECKYLTVSAEWAYKEGPYHQKVKEGTLVGKKRIKARKKAIKFVKKLWNSDIKKIVIENPVGCLSSSFRKPDQYIHPHEYGEDASKRTCLWIKGLPLLVPTKHIAPRIVNGMKRWGNQTDSGQNKLGPSKDREEVRAMTYQGWSDAFASQWG